MKYMQRVSVLCIFLAMKRQEQILESLLCFQQGRSESTHQ